MPRLIAKSALRYASRDLEAGEAFEAGESDAFVLTSLGKATVADEADVAAPQVDPPPAPRRRYNRRDMRAAE